ncbi:DUF6907 domain-containing protein [Embleya sp. NPDC020886]|uniref:DUF6907 domain-containing protein n=1 Tax=Embleya sp. NPDC020886 TaxID=3363980 RepID=UPI0037B9880E
MSDHPIEPILREGCPSWCRGHFDVETQAAARLHHRTIGVTIEAGSPIPQSVTKAKIWAESGPDTALRVAIARCVPPPGRPWRVDLDPGQARNLANLADAFDPRLASALRTVLDRIPVPPVPGGNLW